MKASQVQKPKTQRGKRQLEKRQPRLIENPKNTIFLKGNSCSGYMSNVLLDLFSLKKPLAQFYHKKRKNFFPFQDDTWLERLSSKADTSLFAIGNNTNKRPDTLTFVRMYDHHVLDMIEFSVDDFQSFRDFPQELRVPFATKPMLLFSGEPFDSDPRWGRVRNLMLDFWRGEHVKKLRLEGLAHVLWFFVLPEMSDTMLMRSYRVLMRKSGTRVPRIELVDMGPHLDLRLTGREKLASADLMRLACKVPKQLLPKKVKNIDRNALGSTVGRIHMEKQNTEQLQVRKVKALKKRKSAKENASTEEPAGSSGEVAVAKRPKTDNDS